MTRLHRYLAQTHPIYKVKAMLPNLELSADPPAKDSLLLRLEDRGSNLFYFLGPTDSSPQPVAGICPLPAAFPDLALLELNLLKTSILTSEKLAPVLL